MDSKFKSKRDYKKKPYKRRTYTKRAVVMRVPRTRDIESEVRCTAEYHGIIKCNNTFGTGTDNFLYWDINADDGAVAVPTLTPSIDKTFQSFFSGSSQINFDIARIISSCSHFKVTGISITIWNDVIYNNNMTNGGPSIFIGVENGEYSPTHLVTNQQSAQALVCPWNVAPNQFTKYWNLVQENKNAIGYDDWVAVSNRLAITGRIQIQPLHLNYPLHPQIKQPDFCTTHKYLIKLYVKGKNKVA